MRSYKKPTDDHPKEVKVNQDIHHRQPVRFGLSLRYRLDDRWSVESGLSYTRLSSDITTTVKNETSTTEQRLNYIGLPLNINYDLWKTKHLCLYVSAGGMIEKSLDTSPWQFSLNVAAGAEYKLTNFFSLYAEPGLGYYFKDGSSTPTIYQDHPLNFNLSFGLRFNLK
jgi:opacity protein-like surface antigen